MAEGEEAVILGAFGCGAFMNKPEVVVLAARNAIKDYLNAFKVIEFRPDRIVASFEYLLERYGAFL